MAELNSNQSELRLITFVTGPETFVLDIMAVQQIITYSGSAQVPTAPGFIEGIIVLRNEVIPVIDLRERLYPKLPKASDSLLLITQTTAGIIAIKVDEVRRIISATRESFLPPPAIIHGVHGDLLIAVVKYGKELFLLIDLERLMTSDEQKALQEANLSESAKAVLSGRE